MTHQLTRLRTLKAAGVSLITVLAWIALLGLVFLPREIRQLAQSQPHAILDRLTVAGGRHTVLLTRYREAELRGRNLWEVARLDAAPQLLVSASPDPLVIAAARTGSLVFVGNMTGEVRILDLAATDSEPRLIGRYSDGGLASLYCTEHGEFVVAGGEYGLQAWQLPERRLCWTRRDLRQARCVIDSASQHLLVDSPAGELLELDLRTGQTSRVICTFDSPGSVLALSSDGTRIARTGSGNCLELFDRTSGAPVWPESLALRRGSFAPRVMQFSPCGGVLVTADPADPSCLLIWNVATGERSHELRGHAQAVTGIEFDPAGQLHSWSLDGTIRTWSAAATLVGGASPSRATAPVTGAATVRHRRLPSTTLATRALYSFP